MTQAELLARLRKLGVVPVIAMESVATAKPLAEALMAGGLPIVEITFRTAAAAEIIRTLTRAYPQLLVGAGTVLTRENLEQAHAAGAQFGVAPGLNPAIVQHAHELGLPFLPGVATASEIEEGLELGCKILKLFPIAELGGVRMVNAVSAPYQHTGVAFVPLGGVNAQNLAEYLALGTVAACGGTWLAKKETIAAGDWAAVTKVCREAVQIVRKVRPV